MSTLITRIVLASRSVRAINGLRDIVSVFAQPIAVIHALAVALVLVSVVVSAQSDYVLGPEDKITIQVWDNKDISTTSRISLEGKIIFPLIGEVDAGRLTPGELARHIGDRLADGYLISPQVTVEVVEYKSKKIFVLGEVKSPGSFSLTKKTSLVEAMAMAGGPTSQADREIMVIRSEKPHTGPIMPGEAGPGEVILVRLLDVLEGNKKQNIQILAGDSIYIPKVKVFFITGEVRNPGRYSYQKDMTVLDAISTAGGLTEKSAAKRTRIMRTTADGRRHKIRVTMQDQILPEDTIVVPESFF